MQKNASKWLGLTLLCLPLAAMAHTGHTGHGFGDGFAHPFLGLDHLAAMLVVGIWSVFYAKNIWIAPVSFLVFLTLGAVAGQQGVSLPQIEPLVALSVLVLGLMLVKPLKMGQAGCVAVIAVFALCHGQAHGSELEAGTLVLSGMVLGSALLHLVGMAMAHFAMRQQAVWAPRLGHGVAFLGAALVLNTLL
jgi:urease accessory protein